MGLLLSCEKCTGAGTESVITFSDDLIVKLTEGGGDQYEEEIQEPMLEQDWMERIKCFDESHSVAYGLTMHSFNALVRSIEYKIEKMKDTTGCEKAHVMECYENNPNCVMKCAPKIDKFIDCCDAQRLRQLKQRMDEAAEEERKLAKKNKQTKK